MDYQHKNAVCAEQARWFLQERLENFHQSFVGTMFTAKNTAWAQAMVRGTTGVVIY